MDSILWYNSGMFTEYVQNVMEKLAGYEFIDDAQPYYGTIRGFQGVWARGKTLKECAQNLREVLEEWLLLKIRKNFIFSNRLA